MFLKKKKTWVGPPKFGLYPVTKHVVFLQGVQEGFAPWWGHFFLSQPTWKISSLSLYQSVCLSIDLSICLSIYLPIYLSIYLSIFVHPRGTAIVSPAAFLSPILTKSTGTRERRDQAWRDQACPNLQCCRHRGATGQHELRSCWGYQWMLIKSHEMYVSVQCHGLEWNRMVCNATQPNARNATTCHAMYSIQSIVMCSIDYIM